MPRCLPGGAPANPLASQCEAVLPKQYPASAPAPFSAARSPTFPGPMIRRHAVPPRQRLSKTSKGTAAKGWVAWPLTRWLPGQRRRLTGRALRAYVCHRVRDNAIHLALALLVLACAAPAGLQAQAADPIQAASDQADALFDRRQYKDAAAAYTSLLQAYPNSEFAVPAQFHLAYADFLLGQFPPAVDLLHKLATSPNTPPEMLEDVALLLPQVLAQQAAGAPPADRNAGYAAAVKEYENFISKFPKSASVEAALYGQAFAEYQMADYAGAARDLTRNLAAFPNTETTLDSEYLLAFTLATEANLALGDEKLPTVGRGAAIQNYENAEKYLRQIITRNTDISLANDAQFQLGETLLAHAQSSPPSAQARLYQEALSAYRAVEPKAPMIAAQTARIERLSQALLAERRKGAAANRGYIRQLDQARLREAGKLGALQAKDDPVLTARLKAGAVFFQLERYDETRVLMTALLPEATRPDDQKLALYYLPMTYAAQKQVDKAVAAYDAFQARYSGDPIAENLPLVISHLFMDGPKPDAARADHYLAEFNRLYPQSRRYGETALLEEATTAASLGHFNEAIGTLDKFLQGKPKRELAAAAALSRARIILDQGDLSKALAAFTEVRHDYQERPEAEQAAFWIGYVTAKSGDAAGAGKLLQAFVAQNPQSKLLPAALSTLAAVQQTTGAQDQALSTLADLSARFPGAPEAVSAYFQRANIYLGARKYEDMARVLDDFVAKYPSNDQVFAAEERIASLQSQAGQTEAAAATYQKFLAAQPDSPHAPEALAHLAELWRRAARSLGTYVILGAAQRDQWNADLAKSVAACEQQLARYPEAPATALGLQTLLECQRLLLDAKEKTPVQVSDYFQALAARYQDKPAAHSRILFRLGALTAETDPAKALADLRAAYDPAVVYSPADLDLYTRELLKTDPAAAAAVFAKLAHDYPVPAGATPAQAPPDVQEAQAIVLSGEGQIALAAGKTAAAEAAFADLKKSYPRAPQVNEANLGLAEGLVAAGKFDQAMPLLAEVARAPSAPNNARAHALFLNGKIQQAKGQDGAIDAYLKVAAFYPTAPDAAEGLWLGGQALEKQAAALGETPAKLGGPTKSGQLARARRAYQDLVAHYGSSKWVEQAKQRLAAMPAPPAP
jgi:outer membrane protein assembly factor BamD (BamD/ComL family)